MTGTALEIEQEGLAGTIGVLALIALLPGVGFPAFHHLLALTVGTGNWNAYHDSPPEKRAST
jgi:hypothetical protein